MSAALRLVRPCQGVTLCVKEVGVGRAIKQTRGSELLTGLLAVKVYRVVLSGSGGVQGVALGEASSAHGIPAVSGLVTIASGLPIPS